MTIFDQIIHRHCNINKICITNQSIIDLCSKQSLNGAQFLNGTCVAAVKNCFYLKLSTSRRTSRNSNTSCIQNIFIRIITDFILLTLLKTLLDRGVNNPPADSLSITYHLFVANFEYSFS